MGCIYRRQNSKFYWVRYYKNGKPYAESSHSEKIEVATRLLKKREAEIAEGKLPGICFERVKFGELMEDFLRDYRINKKKSLERAENSMRHLLSEFQGMRVVDITTSRIEHYIEKRMEDGVTNATINRELAALKRMLNLAARTTPPKVSSVPYIPMLSENNIRKGFFEYEEFNAVRDALPDYLKPVITFAYYSGWRRSEILNLTWRNVDIRTGLVRLEPGETKNNQGRTLYLEPELKELLEKLYRERAISCPYVFNYNGHQIGSFRKTWKSAIKSTRISEKLFHDLRRTAVRNMVRAGIHERVAMTISGHKSRSVFDRYNIISDVDLKEAACKRQAFNELQKQQLHFSYTRPFLAHNEKRAAVVTSCNP